MGSATPSNMSARLALVRQTRDKAFPVIPVLMPGCDSPPTGFLELQTWVEFTKETGVLQQVHVLETLRAALARRGDRPVRHPRVDLPVSGARAVSRGGRGLLLRPRRRNRRARRARCAIIRSSPSSAPRAAASRRSSSRAAARAPQRSERDVGRGHDPSRQMAAADAGRGLRESAGECRHSRKGCLARKASGGLPRWATRTCSAALSTADSMLRPKSRTAC